MISEKTKQALKNLGYEVVEDRGVSGELELQWRVSHPLDAEWSNNGMAREACHKTQELAWNDCLRHVKYHSELLMSRMIKSIGGTCIQPSNEKWGASDACDETFGCVRVHDAFEPHEAVYSLWLRTCCVTIDSATIEAARRIAKGGCTTGDYLSWSPVFASTLLAAVVRAERAEAELIRLHELLRQGPTGATIQRLETELAALREQKERIERQWNNVVAAHDDLRAKVAAAVEEIRAMPLDAGASETLDILARHGLTDGAA